MNVDFKLYAVPTSPFGLESEHTFLDVPGYDFNCFGRGVRDCMGDPKTRFVRAGSGSANWAKKIYGPYEHSQDSGLPTGISIRFDGVCQNVANRLLLLTGDGIDTRLTKGNLATILMYGLLGFNIEGFIGMVTKAGAEVAATGEIKDADVQVVLNRIQHVLSADAELEVLHADIPEQCNQSPLPPLTQAQLDACRPIYSAYQKERAGVFQVLAKQGVAQIATGPLKAGLLEPLEKCFIGLVQVLGDDGFLSVFGVTPTQVKALLN